MLSMVLPRKPSLLSDDRSLGPSIVMNSSKSTWPSPGDRHAHRHTQKHRNSGRQTEMIQNQILAARAELNNALCCRSLLSWRNKEERPRDRSTDGCALNHDKQLGIVSTSDSNKGVRTWTRLFAPRPHLPGTRCKLKFRGRNLFPHYVFCCRTSLEIAINRQRLNISASRLVIESDLHLRPITLYTAKNWYFHQIMVLSQVLAIIGGKLEA